MLQAVVLLAAVAYIAYGLANQWGSLRRHEWALRAGPALLSIPLAGGWFFCRAWLWQRLLASFGYEVAYRRAFRAWVLSELARYVPGKIWIVLGRSYFSARDGVPTSIVVTGMAFELVLVTLSASAFVLMRAASATRVLRVPVIWVAVAGALLVILAHPRIITPLVNAALRRLGQPQIPTRLHYLHLLGMVGLCALMWLCLTLGFGILAVSVTPVAPGDLVRIAASFPVAWVIALASVISPAGLGVREGVLAALLAGALPEGVAVVLALASRIWLTVVELLCAALAWALGRVTHEAT